MNCLKICSMNWGEVNSVYTNYIVFPISEEKIQVVVRVEDKEKLQISSSLEERWNCFYNNFTCMIHLLPPPLKRVELVGDDVEALRASLASTEQETVTLRARVESLEDGVRTQRAVMTEQDVETLRAGAEVVEQRVKALLASLGAAQMSITDLMESRRADRLEVAELRSQARDIDASIWEIERHLGP
ncbi:hypothetical protein Tco_0163318 [Tanacetum coccineum]